MLQTDISSWQDLRRCGKKRTKTLTSVRNLALVNHRRKGAEIVGHLISGQFSIKVAVSNTLKNKTLLTSNLSFSSRPEKAFFNYPYPDLPKLNTRSMALFWKGDDR